MKNENIVDRIYERVPHVIPVDITLNPPTMMNAPEVTHYQVQLTMMQERFILRRIATRHETVSIRLYRTVTTPPTVYYDAPGWLHYDNLDYEIKPAIAIENLQSHWVLDIAWRNSPDQMPGKLQVALIGERIQPLP